jgi:3D (Asp-Asp-Asp) domain-containing protein
MKKRISLILIGVATLIGVIVISYSTNCTSGWYITGYFTPLESDYLGETIQIEIDNNTKQYKINFLEDVKTEGWGKTKSGQYIGWYEESFHLENEPKDFHGNQLVINTVAADPSVLKQKTEISIPTLPNPWNSKKFTIFDVGPSIIGKHIDVYTGEGHMAELETERITGHDNIVCVEN